MTALLDTLLANALVACALAALVAVVARRLRRPALVHCLWVLVLVKLVTPGVMPLPVLPGGPPSPRPAAAPAGDPPPPTLTATLGAAPAPAMPWGADEPAAEVHARDVAPPAVAPARQSRTAAVPSAAPSGSPWRLMLVSLWGAGAALVLLTALARAVRFRRVLAHGRSAPRELQRRSSVIARRLGLGRGPGVWLVPGRVSPMLCALGTRARLVLPSPLVAHLTPAEIDSLLAHELAHLRRRDHWVRWLELLATAIFWWLPAVWLVRRALRTAEEQCCDAWVVWSLPDRAEAYARALVKTLEYLAGARSAMPPAASGARHLRHLERRLTMIMDRTPPHMLGVAGRLGVALLAVLMLSFLPTFAQENKQDEIRALKHKLERIEVAIQQLHDAGMREEVARLKRVADELRHRLDRIHDVRVEHRTEPTHRKARERAELTRRIDELRHRAEELKAAGRLDEAKRAMLDLQRLVKAMQRFEVQFEQGMAEREMRIEQLHKVHAELKAAWAHHDPDSREARKIGTRIRAVEVELAESRRALEAWVVGMRNRVHGDLREHTAGRENRRHDRMLRELEKRLHDLELKAVALEKKLHAARQEGHDAEMHRLQMLMERLHQEMAAVRAEKDRIRSARVRGEHGGREQVEEEIVEEAEPGEVRWRTVRGKKGGHASLPHEHAHDRADKLEAQLRRQQEQIAHQQAMIQRLHDVLDKTMKQQQMLTDQVRQLQFELRKARGEPDPARKKRRM